MAQTPQVTLTATLQNLGGAASANSKMRITLANFGAETPTIAGTSILATITQDVNFTGGTLSVNIWGNDVISPAGTFYCISLVDPSGNTVASQNYQLLGTGTIDLSMLTPYVPGAGGNTGQIYTIFARGLTATVAVGSVSASAPGGNPVITNVGTPEKGVLNFVLPRGEAGPQGNPGPTGPPVTFRSTWSNTTTYADGDSVIFTDGTAYVSLQAGNVGHDPSSSGSWWAVLAHAGTPTTFMGAWAIGTTYAQGQAVSYTDGNSYVSLQNANTGNTPDPTSTWWGVLAVAGTVPSDISLNSATFTPFSLRILQPNSLGAVWGIVDDNGYVAMAITATGRVITPTLQTAGNGLVIAPMPTNTKSAVMAIGDVNGNMALIVYADSSVAIAKLSVSELQYGQTTVGALPTNTLGLQGIVVADANGYVAFGIDRNGKIVGTLANPPAAPEILPQGTPTNLHAGTLKPMFGLNLELILGESTGSGINSIPIVSLAQNFANVMFSNGVRNGSITSYTLAIPPLTGLTSFVPLIQFEEFGSGVIAGAIFGETALNGICDRLASDLLVLGVKATFLAACNSLPGAPYTAIQPGSTMYSQLLQIVTAAKSVGASYGSVGVLTTTMVFGINDDGDGTPTATFAADMVAYQAQCQSDIQAITGQTSSIPMVIMQPGRWAQASPGRAVNGLVTPLIAPAQLSICQQYPNAFLFSTPTYFVQPSSDGIHFTGPSEQWLGEYYAETKLNYMLGLPPTWLNPGTPKLLGNYVVIPFSVVNGPLVFDTTQVADTAGQIPGGKYGFEVWDASGTVVPILGATIGQDNASVVLQIGSSPVGGAVGYGWSGVAGAFSGPQTGPRGNLRDSNPAKSLYGHPNMYHWAPHFKSNLT